MCVYEVHTISFQTFFRMGTFIESTHIVQTFLPVTFGYSLSSETVVLRQLRR